MLLYVTVLDLSSKKETFCNNLIFNPFNLIVIHPVECLRVIVGQGQETKRENALTPLMVLNLEDTGLLPLMLTLRITAFLSCQMSISTLCRVVFHVSESSEESRFQFKLTGRKRHSA